MGKKKSEVVSDYEKNKTLNFVPDHKLKINEEKTYLKFWNFLLQHPFKFFSFLNVPNMQEDFVQWPRSTESNLYESTKESTNSYL